MKKEIKEYTDMDEKSCKNCDKCRNCAVRTKVEEISYIDTDFWHCSRWEAKKKTVKLYAYLLTTGLYESLIWCTHPDASKENGYKRVPSEDKEIEL